MLVPFRRETLGQPAFLRDEVRHNLLYRIAEGECAASLQADDGGAVALQTAGRGLWFWIDPGRGEGYAHAFIGELAECLKDAALPSVSADPEHAALFAEAYVRTGAAGCRPGTRLVAYGCHGVIPPRQVSGSMAGAGENDVETVAGFRAGFIEDIYHVRQSGEELRGSAAALIDAGGLFLWVAEGKTVGMASIAHRSPRHARVNNVYTAPAERGKGYASALVAAVSLVVLGEGRVPMLYADMENPVSNHVYRSIGYRYAGRIDEIVFTQR